MWSERHRVLAALRDLFALPVAAMVAFSLVGGLIRHNSGSSFCNSGFGSDLLVGLLFLLWFGVGIGSVRLTRARSARARAFVVTSNVVLTLAALFVVIAGLVLSACSD